MTDTPEIAGLAFVTYLGRLYRITGHGRGGWNKEHLDISAIAVEDEPDRIGPDEATHTEILR